MKLFQENDLPKIKNYKLKSLDSIRIFFYFLIGISTFGLFWLFTYWFQDLLYFLYKNEEDLWKADYILFIRDDNIKVFIKINRKKCRINAYKLSRYYLFICYEGQLMYFSPRKEKFVCVRNQMINYILNHPKDYKLINKGLDKKVVKDLMEFYGKNELEIEVKSFLLKSIEEFLTMINFTQFLIAVIFFVLGRVIYSFIVLMFVLITVFLSTYEYIQNKTKLKNIAELEDQVYVKRRIGNEDISGMISIKELVIGDIIEIEPEKTFPCDLIILEGSCLVNEALLTGESMPIIKNSFSTKSNKINVNNILFSGTQALLNRTKEVKAIVIGTGWNTSKGKLIGSVIFAPEEYYQFEKDFFFLLFLLFIYFLTLILGTYFWDVQQPSYSFVKTLPKLIEYIKCNFPPSLIFIMTASVHLSSGKLSLKKIFTLKSKKILEGGAIKTVCFDKTGTLTELDLKLYGFIIQEDQEFTNFTQNLEELFHFNNYKKFLESLACGHSLTIYNNKVMGDPLEEAMFEKTNAKVELGTHELVVGLPVNVITLSDNHKKILKINKEEKYFTLKDNEFTSDRKRMSVIIQNSNSKKIQIICKGAPEIMKTLCIKNTIPKNYNEMLLKYSEQGYRIISIASKKIENYNHDLGEKEIDHEKDLIFLGFLLFENPLKASTEAVIEELKQNDFEVAMITGDNIYTAINIGYRAGILKKNDSLWIGTLNKKNVLWTFVDKNNNIDNVNLKGDDDANSILSSKFIEDKSVSENHNIELFLENISSDQRLALSGSCFQKLIDKYSDNETIINKILEKTSIYARSSAKQKKLVVNKLKKKLSREKSYVGFVGDGSNDSLALKAANVGLSIGNNESSFSASFFTVLTDIASIKDIIIEGKVCLGNAIQNFKYFMILNMINCFMIFYINFYKWDFVNFDYLTLIFYAFPFAILMSQTDNVEKLTFIKQNPSLLNSKFLISFFSHCLAYAGVIILCTKYLAKLEIYKDYSSITNKFINSDFNYNDFYFVECKLMFNLVAVFVFIYISSFYQGVPFKKPIYTNYVLISYAFFIMMFIILNVFPDVFLSFNHSFYSSLKQTSNIPDYDIEKRNSFVFFSCINLLILFVFGQIWKSFEFYLVYKEKREKDAKIAERDLKLNINKD